MKKGLLVLSLFLCVVQSAVYAQVTGVKNIPGDYATLAAAITDLNTNGVGAGGATINVNANQTAPAGGYLLGNTSSALLTTLSLSNPLVINGNGSNLTSFVGTRAGNLTSGQNDAIFNLVGVDFVTIKRFNFLESASNTTTTTTMEFAVAMYNVGSTSGASNGCQMITIDSNTLNFPNVNTNSYLVYVGAYQYNTTTAASWLGGITSPDIHARITVSNNTITQGYNGVYFRGATTAQARALITQNNTFNNLGGGTGSAYGIYTFYLDSAIHNNNKIAFDAAHGNATTYGIFWSTNNGGVFEAYDNDINLTYSGTSQIAGIYGTGFLGSTFKVKRNRIYGNALANTSTAACYPIYQTYSGGNVFSFDIDSNTIENMNIGGTGTFYVIYTSGSTTAATNSTHNIRGNIINNINRLGTNGTTYLVYTASKINTNFSNNIIDSVYFSNATGATSISLWAFYELTNSGNFIVQNNKITNLFINGTNTATAHSVRGIYASISGNLTTNVMNNQIENLAINLSSGGGTVAGIHLLPGTTGTNVFEKNNVNNLSIAGATANVHGMMTTTGSSNTFINNMISNLSAPASTVVNSIIGLNTTATSGTLNLYHNTVRLGTIGSPLASTGANFGGTAVALSNMSTININNNIFNIIGNGNGTGYFAAIKRTALGVAGTPPAGINLKNNILFSNGYVFGEGTDNTTATNLYFSSTNGSSASSGTDDINFNTSCGQFKSFMAGNASGTFIENNLVAGTISNTWVPSGASFAESAAIPTSPAITTDFSGATRGALADIGALEFSGTATDASGPIINYTDIPNLNCTNAPTLATTITDFSGVNSTTAKPRLYYKLDVDANDFSVANTSAGNGWKWVDASGTAPNFSFAMDFSKLTSIPATGSSINYFVVAQDNLTTPNVGKNSVVFPAGFCPTSVVLGASANGVTGFKSFTFGTAPVLTFKATPEIICVNNPAVLEANLVFSQPTAPPVNYVATGTATVNSTYPNPFYSAWSNIHTQHLLLASDLLAQGLRAGDITAIALDVTVVGTLPMIDLSVKIGTTSQTAMTSWLPPAALTTVYTNPSLLPALGYGSVFNFTTPYNWDGVSNIVLDFCHGNAGSTSTMSRTVNARTTSYISSIKTNVNAATAASTICPDTTTNKLTYSIIPNFRIFGTAASNNGVNFVWKDSLNTTLASTRIYNPSSVGFFTNTANRERYQITATDAFGCVFVDTFYLNKNTSLPTVTSNAFNVQTPCFGDSIAVSFAVANGCPPYTISFKRSNSLGGSTTHLFF